MVARHKRGRRGRRGLQVANQVDENATVIGHVVIPAEPDFFKHPERRRVPCPHRRPQTASTCRGSGIHEGSCRFRRIAVRVEPLEQLEGDLRFVRAATPHDQRAVADRVALCATTDRESTDADLCRQIPERPAMRAQAGRGRTLAERAAPGRELEVVAVRTAVLHEIEAAGYSPALADELKLERGDRLADDVAVDDRDDDTRLGVVRVAEVRGPALLGGAQAPA